MSYLHTTIHFDDFVRWGAHTLLGVTHEDLRAAHFRESDRVTLSYVVDALVDHPGHVIWSVARTELIREMVLHELCAELVASFLARLRAEGTYIDFRTQRLCDTKLRFAKGQASLGELAAARELGKQAWHDVALLNDAKVTAGANAAVAAAHPEIREALIKTAREIYTTYPKKRDLMKLVAEMRCFLAARSPERRAT